jgi:ribosomal protein S18 acetylase RimI-like enzyme
MGEKGHLFFALGILLWKIYSILMKTDTNLKTGAFIRRAVIQDLPYFYEVCLKTADSGKDAADLFYDPYAVGQYFAAPYLVYPEGICFVVEYERLPCGYIVSAPGTAAFNRWMEETWLPPLRLRYAQCRDSGRCPPELIRSEEEGRILALFHHPLIASEPWDDYPAHLHIDLLPVIQGQGWGRALMNTLCTELARQGVPGVHLGVGAKNTGAIAFYRKMGFATLREDTGGLVLGKRCRDN